MVCPIAHIRVAKDFLKQCRKYLIIGTSGLTYILRDMAFTGDLANFGPPMRIGAHLAADISAVA